MKKRLGLVLVGVGLAMTISPGKFAGAADATHVTLVINKGGDRTGPQTSAGLPGAVFDFFAGTSGTPPGGADVPTASCTTGATGTCSVDVAGRDATGQGYWIRERTAPAGYSIAQTLDIGATTAPATYNLLFTGPVTNNTTRTFPEASTGSTNLQARGNQWTDIRDNPPLPDHCGLNIALLIDTSGSISPFLPQVKSAANGFVDALTGTPSRIAVYRFAADATTVLASTPIPDAAAGTTVKNAINTLTSSGGTNWDSGLFQIAAAPTAYDAVLMLTDGNPTLYGPNAEGPGNLTRFREIENGVFSANALKALGTRVVAVGVGSGISGAADNLKAISGPVAGSDYVQTDYPALAALFREIALRTCSGTVNVIKKVVPPAGTPADGVPTDGWTFNSTSGNLTPASGVTGGGSGAVSFEANLAGNPSVPVSLAEVQQAGYTLVQVGGLNASCTIDGAAVTSTNVGALGFTVDAKANSIVVCTVYNRAPLPPAAVVVNKTWNIDGTVYQNPAQPSEFQSALALTDQTDPVWGTTYSGYTSGESVTVGETVDQTLLPPGCTVTPSGDLGAHTLAAGTNTFSVTNTVTCRTTLTLAKTVVNPYGPPEPATSWTLQAFPPGSGTPSIQGTTGVSGDVLPDTRYALAETAVANYTQEIAQGAVIAPPSTGSFHCVLRLRDGTLGPEYDGLNGGVTVQLGQNAICTAINNADTAKLTLVNIVRNLHGGHAVATDWELNAVPPSGSGATPIVGRDGQVSVIRANLNPNLLYLLSEANGPAGYDLVDLSCVLSGTTTPVTITGGGITATLGQDITCVFVNEDLPNPPPPTPSATPSTGPMPVTGSPTAPLAAVGLISIVAGTVLIIGTRRRRDELG